MNQNQSITSIKQWIKDFSDSINQPKVSIAANAEEIMDCLSIYKTLGSSAFSSDQMINPKQMKLNQWNHGLRSGYFQYIPSVEQLIRGYIQQSIDFASSGHFEITALNINNSIKCLDIVNSLYQGNIRQTLQSIQIYRFEKLQIFTSLERDFMKSIPNGETPKTVMKKQEWEHKTKIKNKEKKDIENSIFKTKTQKKKKELL